jgi:hypothetical protein
MVLYRWLLMKQGNWADVLSEGLSLMKTLQRFQAKRLLLGPECLKLLPPISPREFPPDAHLNSASWVEALKPNVIDYFGYFPLRAT